MASTSETGHAINAANLEDLISYCTGYGAKYNPTRAALKLTALSPLLTAAQASITAVITTKTPYDKAVNNRQIAFEPLKRLSTKIIQFLDISDANKKTVEDAKGFNAKIQGKRAKGSPATPEETPKAGEPQPEDKSISVSQQSYDRLVDHFAKLIDLLTAEATYIPNEVPIQVATLKNLLTQLKTTNSAVITATTPYSNALIARDAVLYTETTGLVDIANDVKKYVKVVFGTKSPQNEQVSKIKFTQRKKK